MAARGQTAVSRLENIRRMECPLSGSLSGTSNDCHGEGFRTPPWHGCWRAEGAAFESRPCTNPRWLAGLWGFAERGGFGCGSGR